MMSFRPDKIGVLIVEDDRLLRQSVADYLRQRGIYVSEAESGASFRSLFNHRFHDVLVVDVNLPDISGFELAARAREESDAGIIILSARSGRDDRVSGYGNGADIYLAKPVDCEELTLAIANLAKRRRVSTLSSTPSMGQKGSSTLTLERQRQTLRTPDGVRLKLSARETAFLEYVAARPNTVVSRAEIAEIFGEDKSSPTSRLADACVKLAWSFHCKLFAMQATDCLVHLMSSVDLQSDETPLIMFQFPFELWPLRSPRASQFPKKDGPKVPL